MAPDLLPSCIHCSGPTYQLHPCAVCILLHSGDLCMMRLSSLPAAALSPCCKCAILPCARSDACSSCQVAVLEQLGAILPALPPATAAELAAALPLQRSIPQHALWQGLASAAGADCACPAMPVGMGMLGDHAECSMQLLPQLSSRTYAAEALRRTYAALQQLLAQFTSSWAPSLNATWHLLAAQAEMLSKSCQHFCHSLLCRRSVPHCSLQSVRQRAGPAAARPWLAAAGRSCLAGCTPDRCVCSALCAP